MTRPRASRMVHLLDRPLDALTLDDFRKADSLARTRALGTQGLSWSSAC